jgi:hypothetical protein
MRDTRADNRRNFSAEQKLAATPPPHLLLHRRLVLPHPAGLADVRRGGEPNLRVEVLVKVVFSNRLS